MCHTAVLVVLLGLGQADEVSKIVADVGLNAAFGSAVRAHGDLLLVGAYRDGHDGVAYGSAFVFDAADPLSPKQVHKLEPQDRSIGKWFGHAVDLHGSTGVVGAYGDAELGVEAGAAYLFDLRTGDELIKIAADDGASGDQFGVAVAIDSTHVLVGAPLDNDHGNASGSAYLFDQGGRQLHKLSPDDAIAFDFFGYSTALQSNEALVSALGSRAVVLFDVASGRQTGKLEPERGREDDLFGFDIDAHGGTAVVGAPGDESAYLFDIASRRQLARLTAVDGEAGDMFGSSVAIHGDLVVVGAYRDDDLGGSSGAAYLFDARSGEPIRKLLPSDGATLDFFGMAVAAADARVYVGAPDDDDAADDAGAVYLFSAPPHCAADFNADGELSILDFVDFQLAWVVGESEADCDDNGVLEILDFVCFQQLFAAGCD